MRSLPLRFVFNLTVQSAEEFYAAYKFLYLWFWPSVFSRYRGYALHIYSGEILPGDYVLENVLLEESVAVYESASQGLRLKVTCTKKQNGCWVGYVSVEVMGSLVIDAASASRSPSVELFSETRQSPLNNSQLLSSVPQIRSLSDIRETSSGPNAIAYMFEDRPFLSELVFSRTRLTLMFVGFRLDYQPGRQSAYGEQTEEGTPDDVETGVFDVSYPGSVNMFASSGGPSAPLGRWPFVSNVNVTAATEEYSTTLYEYPPIYTNRDIYVYGRFPFAFAGSLGYMGSFYSTGWLSENAFLFQETQRTTSPFSWWQSYKMEREFPRHFQINFVDAIYENGSQRWI